MAVVHDRSICLRKTEYSETSQILTICSRNYGIVRVIAKGAHRRTKAGASRFDGGIDFLEVGEAGFSHDPARDLPPLTDWHLVEGNQALRKTLRGIYLGLYSAELVGRLIEEHDPHPHLFDRFEATLTELATPRREAVFLAFQLDLLRGSGYLPELFTCGGCGIALDGRDAALFSPRHGGMVCALCGSKLTDVIRMDGRLLRLMQGILKLPRSNGSTVRLPQLTRHQTDPINRMLALHVEQTIGHRMRMPRWILPA